MNEEFTDQEQITGQGPIAEQEQITVQEQFTEQERPVVPQEQITEPQPIEQGGVAVQTEMPQETEVIQASEEPITEMTAQAAGQATVQAAAIEKQIADQEEQDQKLLAALDEVLEKRSRMIAGEEHKRPRTKSERAAAAVQRIGVGFVSLGLILVFMGVVMIKTLSAATPNYTIPLKLSPICVILIGAEMLITHVLTRGKLRVSVTSLVIAVLFVAGCCILCAKLGGNYREEVVEYNNRTIAGEIYDRSYEQLKDLADITSVNVDVNLNPEGSGKLKGVEALSSSDVVDVNVEFGGVYNTPKSFAADCKKVVDSYREIGIYITNFHFANKSRLRSYTLDIEGQFEQDLSESRFEEMVNYIYVDDYDYIEDLEDYVEETSSDESSEND